MDLIDGVQVTQLTQDADMAYIEASRGEEQLSLQAKLVIAAD